VLLDRLVSETKKSDELSSSALRDFQYHLLMLRVSSRFSDDGWDDLEDVENYIAEECDRIAQMLITKNRKYGNSALEPVRTFSKSLPDEQIKVRLDDKLSRIASRQDDEDEDVESDLQGYLVLLHISRSMKSSTPEEEVGDPDLSKCPRCGGPTRTS
jgi:hypothetical protein